MVDVTTTKIRVGRSSGTVTLKKRRIAFAPSIIAASWISFGMAFIAASTISAL
jgi:hypothetical protein